MPSFENIVLVVPDQLASNIEQEINSHSCLKYTPSQARLNIFLSPCLSELVTVLGAYK